MRGLEIPKPLLSITCKISTFQLNYITGTLGRFETIALTT